jgi:hypothetical protein
METKKKLNVRHEAFCMEYRRNGFNGLQAYKKVYKCSDVVAQKNSSKLLTKTDIRSRLDELAEKDKSRYGIDMSELIDDLRELKEFGKREDGHIALKSIDMLIKIAGEYAPTKQTIDQTNFDGGSIIQELEKQKNKLNEET